MMTADRKRGRERSASRRRGSSTSLKTEEPDWKQKPDGKKPTRPSLQLQLAYPGELGTGIAVPRGARAAQSSAATSKQNQQPLQPVNKPSASAIATLDRFVKPKRGPGVSREIQSRATVAKSTTASKGKGRVVDLQEPSEDCADTSKAISQRVASGEIPLVHNTSSSRPGGGSSIVCEDTDLTDLNLPPMPLPALDSVSGAERQLGLFGFGQIPLQPLSPNVTSSTPIRKKRRLVVETSSADRMDQQNSRSILAPPSTPGLAPLASSSPLSPVQSSPQPIARPQQKGVRIPWDSQDTLEARRLNRSPSANSVEAALLGRKRWARQPTPPLVIPTINPSQEVTDYMDQFRNETYSEVDYTMPPSLQEEMLKRWNLSPGDVRADRLAKEEKRRLEMEQRRGSRSAAQMTAVLEADPEISQSSTPFDESATEYTPSDSGRLPSQAATRKSSKFDDSGFVEESSSETLPSSSPASPVHGANAHTVAFYSSPRTNHFESAESAASQGMVLQESHQPEERLFNREPNQRTTALLPERSLDDPETAVMGVENVPDSDDERPCTDALVSDSDDDDGETDESQAFVPHDLIAKRPPQDLCLATDTQAGLTEQTQAIFAAETLVESAIPQARASAASGTREELMVPCSQSEDSSPLFDSQEDEQMGMGSTPMERAVREAIATADLVIGSSCTSPGRRSSLKQSKSSMEDSINSAWFESVFAETPVDRAAVERGLASGKQTTLTKFFERGAQPTRLETRLAAAVAQQIKDSRKARRVSFADPLQHQWRSRASSSCNSTEAEYDPIEEDVAEDGAEENSPQSGSIDIGLSSSSGTETVIPSSQQRSETQGGELLEEFSETSLDRLLAAEGSDHRQELDSTASSQTLAYSPGKMRIDNDEQESQCDGWALLHGLSSEVWIGGFSSRTPSPVRRFR